jgi:hypothetical protein
MLSKFLTSWTYHILITFSCFLSKDIRDKGKALQTRLATSKHWAAAVCSLAEFQEVQLYFVMTTQIAAIITLHDNKIATESTSFGAAITNWGVLTYFSMLGIPNILLVQCCLQRSGLRWWYIFFALLVTILLALLIINGAFMVETNANEMWSIIKSQQSAGKACGDNPSPMTFCPLSARNPVDTGTASFLYNGMGTADSLSFSGTTFIILIFPAFLGLLLDQLASTISARFPGVIDTLARLDHQRTFQTAIESGLIPWVVTIYWAIAEGLLAIMVAVSMSTVSSILGRVSIRDGSKWSFGQFIAMMIWAPIVLKFFYFNICQWIPTQLEIDAFIRLSIQKEIRLTT